MNVRARESDKSDKSCHGHVDDDNDDDDDDDNGDGGGGGDDDDDCGSDSQSVFLDVRTTVITESHTSAGCGAAQCGL